MDLTITGVPRRVVMVLKAEAARRGIRLNDLMIQILAQAAEEFKGSKRRTSELTDLLRYSVKRRRPYSDS